MAAPPDELGRLDALARYRIVGTAPEREYDDLVKLAADATGFAAAMVSFVDAEALWLKAAHGLRTGELPRRGSPCELAIAGDETFELHDTATDARFAHHPLIADAQMRAYAAVPLREAGHVVGTLAVLDREPRVLDAGARWRLITLAQQTVSLLQLRRLRDQRLVKTEALLSSATRISGVGCWQWDMIRNEVTWSEEMYKIFGISSETPPSVELFRRNTHPDDRALMDARRERALRGEETNFADIRIIRPDGEVRIVHAMAEMERDATGRPYRLTGALYDVTTQRAAEEQRKQLAISTLHSQKLESLGVLAAGVAHDFNNLLVGVTGNAELALADRSIAPTTRDLVERIMESAHRAGALTRQLLAYTGRSHLKLIDVDLATQLGALLERLRGALPRRITLDATLPTGLPAVRLDLDQLALLASNLLSNAAESYGEHAGEVRMRVQSVEVASPESHDLTVPHALTPGRYVVLEVYDRGCGMPAATLERALEPFYTTKFTGRGLGLSAVLGIARSHSAVLTVDTRVGEGSLVRMYFPALDRIAAAATRPASDSTVSSELAGRTILLVDDEQLVRNVERMAMQRVGIRVLEACDGQQAIDMLTQHREVVDLVVLDLVMPGLDAATTLRGLRALRPDLPVILQSGYTEEEATRSVNEIDGRLEFLQKPFSVRDLLRKLDLMLRPE